MSYWDLVVTKWGARFRGREFPVAIGRGGIGEKRGEGDGITPRGAFLVEGWYERRDRGELGFSPIGVRDGWSDDARMVDYNRLVRLPYRGSHERLFRADGLYDLIGVVNYNRAPVVAGRGSAIFLHIWRRPRYPTEGCVAFARGDLAFIAANWDARSKLIIQ